MEQYEEMGVTYYGKQESYGLHWKYAVKWVKEEYGRLSTMKKDKNPTEWWETNLKRAIEKAKEENFDIILTRSYNFY